MATTSTRPRRTRLGRRISKVRKERGLSSVQLSVRAGLGLSHIGQIERGAVRSPSTDTMVKIARALGVSVLWLMTGEGSGSQAA